MPPAPVPTTVQQVHDAFIALEEECGWWDLEAYGQRYWHQLRYPVFGQVLQALGVMGQRQRSWRDRSLSSWLANLRPSHWPAAVRRSLWFDVGPAEVLVINHPRHVPSDGHWICPYTHPLLTSLSQTHWTIEDVWQGVHSHPQPGYRLKYLEWPFLLAQIGFFGRHGLVGGRLNRRERATVAAWRDQLERRLGGAPSLQKSLSMTRAAVREVAAFRGLYGRLLDRVRPKLIVNVVHYSYRCLTLTTMARERSIPVAELQHGTMGAAHLAYNFAPGRHPPGFPDYLLTFGDWWRDVTPGLPLAAAAVPAVGYAWLEQNSERARRRGVGRKPTVLFVSQAPIGVELSRLAVALSKRAGGRLTIRYKLHPGELLGWRERYPWLSDAPFEVIDEPTNFYAELGGSDMVVGVYSTALFEAVAFGRPLLLADLPGIETMKPLLELGAATLCSDAAELLQAIVDAEAPPAHVRELLWKPGAVDNFQSFLQRTLE